MESASQLTDSSRIAVLTAFGVWSAPARVQRLHSYWTAGIHKESLVGILIVVLVVLAIIALLVYIFGRRR